MQGGRIVTTAETGAFSTTDPSAARVGESTPILPNWIEAPARTLMALLFLLSGVSKLTGVGFTQAYMAAFGVPVGLLWPAAAFEITCGALLLAGWCLLTAAVFHTAFADPVMFMMFLKNVTLAGSFLLLARTGAPGLGIDGLLSRRKRIQHA